MLPARAATPTRESVRSQVISSGLCFLENLENTLNLCVEMFGTTVKSD